MKLKKYKLFYNLQIYYSFQLKIDQVFGVYLVKARVNVKNNNFSVIVLCNKYNI